MKSIEFIGILIMALACIAFCAVFIPSWYKSKPRRFWLARLTYEDDKEQQSFIRVSWCFAWGFAFIGSLLCAGNQHNLPSTFWWYVAQTLLYVILVWFLAKISTALIIVGRWVVLGIIRLKDWILHDKPFIPKYNKLKPLNS